MSTIVQLALQDIIRRLDAILQATPTSLHATPQLNSSARFPHARGCCVSVVGNDNHDAASPYDT